MSDHPAHAEHPEHADAAYPGLVFETLTAYRRTAALKGAIDLDLFTAIASGASTAAAIGARCGAAERGVRILCDCMVWLGFLCKHGDDYALTPISTDSALLTYRTWRRQADGSERHVLRSSIWKHDGRRWQMLFHQGTPTRL